MSVRVYVYEKCSTCRDALKFLTTHGIEHVVVPIYTQPPTVAELRAMLGHVGGEVRRLFNSSGLEYKALKMKERLPAMPLDEALALLASNGRLVKRPFALSAEAGVVGFRAGEWEQFIAR